MRTLWKHLFFRARWAGWVGGVGMGNFIFVMLEASMDGSNTA